MYGTLLNMLTVAIGGTLGLLIGDRLPKRMQESIVTGLGLMTFFFGLQNAALTKNPLIVLFSVVIGVMIGEWLRIDLALERFGGWLQTRFAAKTSTNARADTNDNRTRFITGFVTASLLFCVGPLTFVGAMLDGMGNPSGFQQLAIKSVLDGFASIAFAASFGVGVLFTLITILVVQGGLALLGSVAGQVMTDPMIFEMTAVGGIMLMGLSLILLDLKKPRMANFLPALVIAPLIVAVAAGLGINIFP
jgi:uncharacterized protein